MGLHSILRLHGDGGVYNKSYTLIFLIFCCTIIWRVDFSFAEQYLYYSVVCYYSEHCILPPPGELYPWLYPRLMSGLSHNRPNYWKLVRAGRWWSWLLSYSGHIIKLGWAVELLRNYIQPAYCLLSPPYWPYTVHNNDPDNILDSTVFNFIHCPLFILWGLLRNEQGIK